MIFRYDTSSACCEEFHFYLLSLGFNYKGEIMEFDLTLNLQLLIKTSINAGVAILDVYNTEFGVEYKRDNSPLTVADKKAHDIISAALSKTGMPVLSEEGKEIPFSVREKWEKFWLVDPLDGTKEFIKRNGEFTVNIALIENGSPILGVVYAPVLDELYLGYIQGAFKIENASKSLSGNISKWGQHSKQLPITQNTDTYKIVASRSHLSIETEGFIKKKKQEFSEIEIVSKGSSLKLCLVAEGTANVYPRFAPTMEWDTAAGHAIIKAAGGRVLKVQSQSEELKYNKEDLLNPWFIAETKF